MVAYVLRVGASSATNYTLTSAVGAFSLSGQSATLTSSAATGQLAAGHWVPAVMPLTSARIVHPRPDSETNSYAYHRNAHVSIPYECPIFVQGGAYPFWYEIISAPSGTTVGQFYNSADYGVVKWTPTSGTQTFVIRVHDQDGATVDVTWTAAVGTSWVSFVDNTNGDDTTGTGTFGLPWKTYSKACSSVTGGKAVCFRTGTYLPNFSLQSLSSSLHQSLIGFPGETVTFNCAGTNTTSGLWGENSADTWVSNIRFTGALLGTNPRHFSNFAAADRQYKWKVVCSNSGGTSGNDNSAFWFLGEPGTQRNYIALSDCQVDHMPSSSNGYITIDTYDCKYVLVDKVGMGTPSGSPPQHMIFIKGGGCQEITTQNSYCTAAQGTDLVNLYLGSDGGSGRAPTNQEMRYNTIVSTNTSNNHAVTAVLVNNAQNNSAAATVWSYRNTIYGLPAIVSHSVNALTFTSINDVIVHDATTSGLTGKWIGVSFSDSDTTTRNPTTIPGITYSISGVEAQGTVAAGIVDGSYLLTGAYRTSYLGLRGAEIA